MKIPCTIVDSDYMELVVSTGDTLEIAICQSNTDDVNTVIFDHERSWKLVNALHAFLQRKDIE